MAPAQVRGIGSIAASAGGSAPLLTPSMRSPFYLDSLHHDSRCLIDGGGFVQVANRRDPRATRSAPTSGGAAHVGGSCLPTWASPGGGSGEGFWLWMISPASFQRSSRFRNVASPKGWIATFR